jgi:hypothetical protein
MDLFSPPNPLDALLEKKGCLARCRSITPSFSPLSHRFLPTTRSLFHAPAAADHRWCPVAAPGVFLGILVNTKDFCKTRQNNYDFGKNCGDFSKMNTKVTK